MTCSRSRTAAPVGLVTITIRRGKRGKRPLPRRVEQPFERQLGVTLAKRQLEGPDPLGLDLADHDLVFPARRVDRQASQRPHGQPVGQVEGQPPRIVLPHDGADRRRVILEREVDVTRPRPRHVGDLAVQGDLGEVGLEASA